jgi:hypothetical protein
MSITTRELDVVLSDLEFVRSYVAYPAALCTPIWFTCGIAWVLRKTKGGWKAVGIIAASLLSLPIGLVLVFESIRRWDRPWAYHHNPGEGIAAYPLLPIWALTFVISIGISLWIFIPRIGSRRTTGAYPVEMAHLRPSTLGTEGGADPC